MGTKTRSLFIVLLVLIFSCKNQNKENELLDSAQEGSGVEENPQSDIENKNVNENRDYRAVVR